MKDQIRAYSQTIPAYFQLRAGIEIPYTDIRVAISCATITAPNKMGSDLIDQKGPLVLAKKNRQVSSSGRWITKVIYEAKLKQYDSELNCIEDKLISVDDRGFLIKTNLPQENWTS